METRTVSPVIVGRSGELTALSGWLARADGGEPQACVIGGEAGVGKTRLLEEFLDRARAAGAVTAVGGCVELGADGLPFAPVAALLRSLHRRLGPELAAAVRGQESDLARLLPELGEASPVAGDDVGRARLFELTTRLLEQLAVERPLVVAVEDLHWADRSTRELLGYLFRSVQPGTRLLVLATYRADDLHRRHPLRHFLAELDRLRTVRRLELRQLTRNEVAEQLAGIKGVEPSPDLVRTVFERSQGNPFFVEELTTGDSMRCGMSETLRDLLLVRVEELPEDAQEVLRLAAEGGSALEHGLLEAVARCPENVLLGALRTAVGAHLLVPTEDGDGYRFRHALMREAVIDDLLPGERTRLNRRYAEALEDAPQLVSGDQRSARLASYWYHAGDAAKALPAVLDAAVDARRRYAYAEQLSLLERALELWDRVPRDIRDGLRPADHIESYPVDDSEQPLRFRDLLAEAMAAAHLSDQPDRGWVLSKQALRLLDEQEDPLRAAWFWTHRSRVREQLGRGDGLAELVRAQELIGGLPPSMVHAQVLSHVAAWQMVHKPEAESFGLAERAVEMARLVGARNVELHARFTLGNLKSDAGDIEGGIAEMRAVRDRLVSRDSPSSFGIGRTLVNLSAALARTGRLTESLDSAREGIELCDRFGLTETKPWLYGNLGKVLEDLGRWDEAERMYTRARQRGRESRTRGADYAHLGWLRLVRGDLAAAEQHLASARRELDLPDLQKQFSLQADWLAVEVAAAHGRIVEGRARFAEAVSHGLAPFMVSIVWQLLQAAAAMESDALGVPSAAAGRAEALDRIRAVAATFPAVLPIWVAAEALLRAELSRAEGRSDAQTWQEAAEAYAALPEVMPYPLAQARHGWAEALVADGGAAARRQAAGLLRQAREAAAGLRAVRLLTRIDQLARRARLELTAPAAPGSPASRAASGPGGTGNGESPENPFGLTRRERDVLALVASGGSNRQIAGELFISPKTVSVHVSNILAKLEVSSRGEAAALAHRLGMLPATPG
ncbi:AAA family ATPase [Streptomyces sp. ACA25]|uniref:helix-turn-helix transcriptional regulator n=1 Tax=Streptomyces sp. ACA25 TaxID=3022596 RepID=UPI002307B468|nr:AAA family ATPase [Streptomyces sp. ACA25]MDB1088376.1 AAA family ATPase [Streptomyces sp. ACA25]